MTGKTTHWTTLTAPATGLPAALDRSRTSLLKPLIWLFASSVVYGLALLLRLMLVDLSFPEQVDHGFLWGAFSLASLLNAGALVLIVLAAAAFAQLLQRLIPLGLTTYTAASLAAHVSLPMVLRFGFLMAALVAVDPVELAGMTTRLSIMDPFAVWVVVLVWVAARRALKLQLAHALIFTGVWGLILGAGPMAGGWLLLAFSN